MSLPQQLNIRCKGCGAQQEFIAWRTLNASINPEAKELLLTGELMRFACAKCRWTGPIIYPLLYHDMEKCVMVWLRENVV